MPHREAYNTSGDHDTARVLEYRGGWLCSITAQAPGHGIGPRGETTKGFKVEGGGIDLQKKKRKKKG
jgi:hypothetical protein